MLAHLAEQALVDGSETEVEPRLTRWLKAHPDDIDLLHWCAMLRRALDRRGDAIDALQRAVRLDPDNAGLMHALAHVTLEAGLPASALFEHAIRLAPAKAEMRLGLVSARYHEGEGERGLAELDAMLTANPGWMEGHRQYAQTAALLGRGDTALASLERALDRFPQGDALRKLAIDMLLEAERYPAALARVDGAIALRGALGPYVLQRAAILDELGRCDEAANLYRTLGMPSDPGHAVWRVRHWLRTGDVARAVEEVEPWLAASGAEPIWPYAALAWRLSDDPRSRWLDGQPGLWKVVDLDPEAIGLADLRTVLRDMHTRAGRFLDQSVVGGTQTEGALFARVQPEIAKVREAVRREVERFIAQLPAQDADHPMLSQSRRGFPRFSGSWSVRLTDAGFHSAHHHPQGWISSALYVSVPETLPGGEGSLDLGGSPADLGLGLTPLCTVEPREGRLVLFPSWMWHATRPFTAGERMSIAFDVARA